jgi:hypothetical protein
MSSLNEQEQKSQLFSRYPHSQHGSSSIDKSNDYDDNHNLLSHVVKAQRHSDPYSIKWITQGPHRTRDSGMYFT